MAKKITITNPQINSGQPIGLMSAELVYGWKNNINTDSINTGYALVESQNSGYENPIINLTFFIPLESSSSIATSDWCTWQQWMSFAKNRYDGTDSTLQTLSITLGTSTPLISYALNSTTLGTSSIPFVVKSFNMRTSPDDSLNGKWLTISAQLIEDKHV